jgi:protein TonB
LSLSRPASASGVAEALPPDISARLEPRSIPAIPSASPDSSGISAARDDSGERYAGETSAQLTDSGAAMYASGPGGLSSGGDVALADPGFGEAGRSGSISRETFLAWLDKAIRARLLYPERARRRNLQGTVELFLSVKADGSACVVRVVRGSGSPILDSDAVSLIRSLFPAPVHPGEEFADSVRIVYVLEKK